MAKAQRQYGGILYSLLSYRKLVIIGDGACGKTSLLSVFTLGYFPTVWHHLLGA